MTFGDTLQSSELLILLLLAGVAVFALLARWIKVAYPIVLVVAGLLVSFVPHIPRIALDPDVVFLLFLPPLLYSSANATSWRDFRHNLTGIAFLAVGLVVFTVFGIALFADRFVTALDFKAGLVLGAVVAATDAIAATSIARSLGLPRRIVDILEGESLLNDATGLLALEFGVQLLRSGESPTLSAALLRLVYLALAGAGIGLLIGWATSRLTAFITLVEDGPVQLTLSLIVPYFAYLAGEAIHASGVFAVVSCGLYVSRQNARVLSPPVRLQINGVWDALTFILNGLVFLLIGLQLPFVLAAIAGEYSHATLIKLGVAFSVLLIALRMVWTYPAAWLAHFINQRLLHHDDNPPTPKGIFVIGWTGMRGVVALAAALSLPEMLAPGKPFAARNLIVFLSFTIILVTLVLQGLTLPPLIRFLALANPGEGQAEELLARRATIESAIQFLESQPREESDNTPADETFSHLRHDLLHRYHHRLAEVDALPADSAAGNPGDPAPEPAVPYLRMRQLLKEVTQHERETLIALRDRNTISDDTLRLVERELDLLESRAAPTPLS